MSKKCTDSHILPSCVKNQKLTSIAVNILFQYSIRLDHLATNTGQWKVEYVWMSRKLAGIAFWVPISGSCRTTYAKYEAGELNIRASVLLDLTKIYDCSYDDFFEGLE